MQKIKIKPKYDAVVIGAGMGGLLASAFLVKKGYSTCLLERLSFCGGKFTGFNYKGFQIPSGAFHMIPAAEKGPLGKCFADLGLNIKYRHPKSAAAFVLEEGKRYPIYSSPLKSILSNSYLWKFGFSGMLEFARMSRYFLKNKETLPDIPFADFLNEYTGNWRAVKIIDQMLKFANGTDIRNASLSEFRHSISPLRNNSEGLIVGGCRQLIEELTGYIKNNGGEIYNKTAAEKILFKGSSTAGVEIAGGKKISAGLVVSNAGPSGTRALLGKRAPEWFLKKEKIFSPVAGISYSVATDSPLLPHDAVEVPISCDNIAGYIQISNLDSGLAPRGKHLLLAAQMVLDPERDMAEAVESGKKELLCIFPRITEKNIINISSFHRGWAAAPTGQLVGQTGESRYPVKVDPFENLYMLGYDSQGWGFAAEVIGHAALNFKKMI